MRIGQTNKVIKIPNFGDVIFKNKSWKLSWTGHYSHKTPTEIRIEARNKSFIDYAMMYSDGRVVYDYPESVPDYIKEKVKAALYKSRR